MHYSELKTRLSQGEIAPVYLFYGEEDYLIAECAAQLKKKVLSSELGDFNYNLFYGEETTADTIINAARIMPVLASRRLVVVRNVQYFKEPALSKLTAYAASPSPTTVLILIGNKLENKSGWIKSMARQAVVVRFYPLFEHKLASWIISRAHAEGYGLTSEGAQILLEATGNDLQLIQHELDKLFAYVGERRKILAQEVELVCGHTRQYSIFELVEAIGNKDCEKAVSILGRLLAEGEAPLSILGMISRQLRLIWVASEMIAQGLSEAEIMQKLGWRSKWQKKLVKQATHFKTTELPKAFEHLLACDTELKSGTLSPQVGLEFLLLKLCGLEGNESAFI